MKTILIGLIAFLFVGCGNTNQCVYPTFPKPNKAVLEALKKTNSNDVDLWVEDLLKLKMKLEVME